MGEDIWKYISKRKNENDNIGLKRVQQGLSTISENMDHQMLLIYSELTIKQKYVRIILKKNESVVDDLVTILSNSLKMFISDSNNTIILSAVTNIEGLYNIVLKLNNKIEQVFIYDQSIDFNLFNRNLLKFNNYDLFNPEKKEWCCNSILKK